MGFVTCLSLPSAQTLTAAVPLVFPRRLLLAAPAPCAAAVLSGLPLAVRMPMRLAGRMAVRMGLYDEPHSPQAAMVVARRAVPHPNYTRRCPTPICRRSAR